LSLTRRCSSAGTGGADRAVSCSRQVRARFLLPAAGLLHEPATAPRFPPGGACPARPAEPGNLSSPWRARWRVSGPAAGATHPRRSWGRLGAFGLWAGWR
jgi:hypothetical protein